MKIGLVSPYYFDRFGGVQSLILAIRTELISRGHEVKIIAPKPRKKGDGDHHDHVLMVGASAEIKLKALNTTFPVAVSVRSKEIDDLLEQESFDVLHVHEPWLPMLANQIVQRATCPVVGTLHANWPESAARKSLGRAAGGYFRTAASKVDVLTAVSEAAGAYAHKSIERDIEIVPNGIDLKEYDSSKTSAYPEKSKSLKTIAYIGRLEKRKGVIYLLKAYRQLIKSHPDVELIIAGSGPGSRSLKDFVRRNKLTNVKFVGFISEEEKKQLLKSADVYCSPALFGESFGIVLLEAMAMGTVTVAGNNPGYASVMSGRGRLSLIDPQSIKDFAYRLELMLYDEQIRELWQSWAKDYVKQYDFPVITDCYEKIYKRLADKNEKK